MKFTKLTETKFNSRIQLKNIYSEIFLPLHDVCIFHSLVCPILIWRYIQYEFTLNISGYLVRLEIVQICLDHEDTWEDLRDSLEENILLHLDQQREHPLECTICSNPISFCVTERTNIPSSTRKARLSRVSQEVTLSDHASILFSISLNIDISTYEK